MVGVRTMVGVRAVGGRGNSHDRSPSPTTSAFPDGERSRGRQHGRGRGTRRRTVPIDNPNYHYSFSNAPPFISDPQGPIFSLRKPESAGAYTYFLLLFDDDLLTHIGNQMNLYARLHPFC